VFVASNDAAETISQRSDHHSNINEVVSLYVCLCGSGHFWAYRIIPVWNVTNHTFQPPVLNICVISVLVNTSAVVLMC